jgi:hypothetical protein
MATVVKEGRAALQDEYRRLRVRIFDYYRLISLVAPAPGAREHQLPPKLGHWSSRHSALVRAVHGVLWPTVDRIEVLRGKRDPKQIEAQHTWLRRGDNFRRKRAPGTERQQLNPGYWPPIYKKY